MKNKTSLNKNGNLAKPDFARSRRVRGLLAPHHRAPTTRTCQDQVGPSPETPADATTTRPLTSNAQVRTTTQCSERSDLQLRRLARLAPPECSGGDAKADPRDFFRFVTSGTRFVTPIHSEDTKQCLKNKNKKRKKGNAKNQNMNTGRQRNQVSIGKPQVRKDECRYHSACSPREIAKRYLTGALRWLPPLSKPSTLFQVTKPVDLYLMKTEINV